MPRYFSNEGLPNSVANGLSWLTAYEDLLLPTAQRTYHISGIFIGGFNNSSNHFITFIAYTAIFEGNNNSVFSMNGGCTITNFIFRNYSAFTLVNNGFIKTIRNNLFFNIINFNVNYSALIESNNLINCNIGITAGYMNHAELHKKNTHVNCTIIYSNAGTNAGYRNNAFINSSITYANNPTDMDYAFFLNTTIRFTGGNATDIASIPRFKTKAEATAAGANPVTESLEGKVEAEWGAVVAGNCFQNAIVDDYNSVNIDDVFVDAANMNFHLKPGCRAVNAGSDGKNMGSQPTGGLNFAFPADFHSYTNLNANGNIINTALPAQAISKVKSTNNGTAAIVKRVSVQGVELHAIGNLIDRIGNLNKATPILSGGTLIVGKKYHCTGEAISLTGGRAVLAGANFIPAAGETSFLSNEELAIVYEIVTERDNRNIKTIGIKAHNVLNTEAEFVAVPAFNYEYNADVFCNVDLGNNLLAGNGDSNYLPAFASNLHRAYVQLIIDYTPDNIPQ